ncbi:hypothetical protein [Saccharicrinis aurantiacus]|uniref:hypothetical protein n=1 Tax=Saccharicrinis aurantiacus TaxID=1849719 RepID=UPI00094FD35C|nr:hypothetical protein [Saccharicrinis aurantiacus]
MPLIIKKNKFVTHYDILSLRLNSYEIKESLIRYNIIMKKTFIVGVAVVFILALGFTSCKTTQDCPAYSKAKVETNMEKA